MLYIGYKYNYKKNSNFEEAYLNIDKLCKSNNFEEDYKKLTTQSRKKEKKEQKVEIKNVKKFLSFKGI